MTQEEISGFFGRLLDVEGAKLLWLLGSKNGRKQSFWYEDTAKMADGIAAAKDSEYHVYFGVGSRKKAMQPWERGEHYDYLQYKTLWLDIDVLGPNHKSDRLPPSIQAATELLGRLPLDPTYVVSSGGGLQAYWALTEAVSASELEEFLPAWYTTWKAFGEERGWHVDNVFDLGRVMRAPGSVNRKNDAPVEILKFADRQYSLDDFDAYLREPEVAVVAPREDGASERPGDAYNRMHAGDAHAHAQEILEDYGFRPLRPKANGEMPFIRPDKTGLESSATIYPDGHCTVYSSEPSLPTTVADKVGKPLDPFGVYTMFVHEGDFEKATALLRAEGYGDPLADDSWVLKDLAERQAKPPQAHDLLDAIDPEAVEAADASESRWVFHNLFDLADAEPEEPPSVGIRHDGVSILYPAKVHTVFGEPGGMKSWFTQCIGAQTVEGGGNCLWIDFENSKKSTYDRFTCLGSSGDELRHITVTTPDCGFGPAERKAVEELCAERKFELIVVDGTTDAMVAFGLDPNGSVDAAKFDKAFLKVLAATGAAVIYVDHVTKDKESRGSWGFGSQHKKSAIDGASFGVEMVSSFGKGMHGRAKIMIHKDKPGDLLQHALEGVHTPFCELDMVSNVETGAIEWVINEPSTDLNPDFRPTAMMERIATYIERHPGLARDVVITGSGVAGGKRAWIGVAFGLLEAEGYIRADMGDSRNDKRYRSLKAYAEAQDYLDHHQGAQADPEMDARMAVLRKRLERRFGAQAAEDGPVAAGVALEDLV